MSAHIQEEDRKQLFPVLWLTLTSAGMLAVSELIAQAVGRSEFDAMTIASVIREGSLFIQLAAMSRLVNILTPAKVPDPQAEEE